MPSYFYDYKSVMDFVDIEEIVIKDFIRGKKGVENAKFTSDEMKKYIKELHDDFEFELITHPDNKNNRREKIIGSMRKQKMIYIDISAIETASKYDGGNFSAFVEKLIMDYDIYKSNVRS